jgi:hypothetical protein
MHVGGYVEPENLPVCNDVIVPFAPGLREIVLQEELSIKMRVKIVIRPTVIPS